MPFTIYPYRSEKLPVPEAIYTLAEVLFNPLSRGEDLTPDLLDRIPDPY